MNIEQRGMLSLIGKESFRNSGSRWSAASQAGLMLVRRYALSDDNEHTPVLVSGQLCKPAPSYRRKQDRNYCHSCHGSSPWSRPPSSLAPSCLWAAPGAPLPCCSLKRPMPLLSSLRIQPHKAHGIKTANHPPATPLRNSFTLLLIWTYLQLLINFSKLHLFGVKFCLTDVYFKVNFWHTATEFSESGEGNERKTWINEAYQGCAFSYPCKYS